MGGAITLSCPSCGSRATHGWSGKLPTEATECLRCRGTIKVREEEEKRQVQWDREWEKVGMEVRSL